MGGNSYLIAIFGDHVIKLPVSVIPRWKQCIEANSLLMWRSFGFLLAAEAKMAEVNGEPNMSDDLKFLFEAAMQRVYQLQPVREGHERPT